MKTLFCAVLAAMGVSSSAHVEFSRTIKDMASDSSVYLEFADGCASKDDYGSNDCKFAWGQSVDGTVAGKLGHDLDEGSIVSVNLKVDTIIPWKFSCAACGSNCSTTVPIVDYALNFATPPCPISSGKLESVISQALPNESPTKGVKVTAKGSVHVKDQTGADVVSMDVHLMLK